MNQPMPASSWKYFPGGRHLDQRVCRRQPWHAPWDKFSDLGHHRQLPGKAAPLTNYTVRITAAAIGYGDWTQITDDFNAGNYVYLPAASR